MFDMSKFLPRCAFGVSVAFCLFVCVNAESLLDGDVRISGNTTLDQDVEIMGSTLHRNSLILQKESGAGAPYIDIKEDGGLLKGRLYGNPTTGQQGLSLSLDGVNPCIVINDDQTIELGAATTVDGDLIVSGNLIVSGDSQSATPNTGDLFLSTNFTYTLGDPISFDQIIDPGSHITGSPYVFVAPISGYYLVTVRAMGSNLTTTDVFTGTPMCEISIKRNSDVVLSAFQPMLTFGNVCRHALSGTIRLTEGDEVCTSYTMFTTNGEITGTIELAGDEDGISTYMNVHYLSSEAQGPL